MADFTFEVDGTTYELLYAEKRVEMAEVVTDVGYRLQINSTITKNNVREAPQLLKRVIRDQPQRTTTEILQSRTVG